MPQDKLLSVLPIRGKHPILNSPAAKRGKHVGERPI